MQQHYLGLLLGFTVAIFQQQTKVNAKSLLPDLTTSEVLCELIIADNPEHLIEKKTFSNLFQQLNLTPQQKQKIGKISRRYQGQISQIKQDLLLAQQQLAAMMAGTDSSAVVRAKHKEIAQLRQQLGQLHFESMLATREILTPEQRQKFAEIIEARQ